MAIHDIKWDIKINVYDSDDDTASCNCSCISHAHDIKISQNDDFIIGKFLNF